MSTDSTSTRPPDASVAVQGHSLPPTGVFHTGEVAVQQRTGERALAQRRGAMIDNRLGEAARGFLALQGLAAVAAAGPDGAPWASLWCGEPGFLRGDEQGEHVEVISTLDHTLDVDPVRRLIQEGAPLGMLAIDLVSRRRLRVNGTISRAEPTSLELRVRETFGNCIKYIQRRHRSDHPPDSPVEPVERGTGLDRERLEFIARTDTFFVASMHGERGLDASHRGGEPGFLHVAHGQTLQIPDYPGNAMYQTLGNLAVEPRAGLALIDFERRRILSLTGRATVEFDAENLEHPTGGTGRYWSFTPDRWVEFSLPSTMTWTLIERSPFNPRPSHSRAGRAAD